MPLGTEVKWPPDVSKAVLEFIIIYDTGFTCKRAMKSDLILVLMIFSGADSGFLERGFICIKVWGFALLILSNFSSIPQENEIIW